MSVLGDGFLLAEYRILKILRPGGFSVTYLARDEQLGRLLEIMEYFPSDLSFRSGVTVRARERCEDQFACGKARFIEEAQILARFDHPSFVRVLRVFDANNTSYIVREHLSGRSLKQWAAELAIPPMQAELDRLIVPLLDALSMLHRNGTLHQGVSPDHVYVRDSGPPVLLGFGAGRPAMAQRQETVAATVKPGFSPVEQYSTKDRVQGPWSDIYGFAATIYFVVTGAPPKPATERLIRDDHVSAKQGALGRDRFRETFLAAIDWGLALAPSQRPQSIEQWRPALLSSADIGAV